MTDLPVTEREFEEALAYGSVNIGALNESGEYKVVNLRRVREAHRRAVEWAASRMRERAADLAEKWYAHPCGVTPGQVRALPLTEEVDER